MEDIEELSSKDTLLDYVAFSCLVLKDADPKSDYWLSIHYGIMNSQT